ncbi:MAG: SAM-dependent methyltransferase [Acidimicrobiales bacterium]
MDAVTLDDTAAFQALVAQAMAAPVVGWRFPFLEERLVREPPSWDYAGLARTLLVSAATAVDHGTGGGEVLRDLGVVPPLLVATEAFPPNVAVAAGLLGPAGACVAQVSGETHNSSGPGEDNAHPARRLPFRDSAFDVFLCRNGAFCAAEAFRMLRPSGHLLHQSGLVGPRRAGEVTLRDYFVPGAPDGWGPWPVRDRLLDAGFVLLDYREELTRILYLDIAAVVFALRMVPWTVGEFRLDDHRSRLFELHRQIARDGPLVTASTGVYAHAVRP